MTRALLTEDENTTQSQRSNAIQANRDSHSNHDLQQSLTSQLDNILLQDIALRPINDNSSTRSPSPDNNLFFDQTFSLRPKFAILKPAPIAQATSHFKQQSSVHVTTATNNNVAAATATAGPRQYPPTPDWFFTIGEKTSGSNNWGPFSMNKTMK